MKKTFLLISALFLINLIKAQDNNIYQVENNCDEIVLDITKINTFEQRMHFLYSILLDERFNINTSDRDGFFNNNGVVNAKAKVAAGRRKTLT